MAENMQSETPLLAKSDAESDNVAPDVEPGNVVEGDSDAPAGRALIISLCVLFFLQALSSSTWGRFGAIYYVNVARLEPEQIGIIEGTMPLVRLFAQPLWGVIADKFHRRKAVALVTSFIGTSLLLLLAFSDTIAHGFDRVWLISVAMAFFSSPGILDAYALEALGPGRSLQYGRIRLWSAASWGIGNLVIGVLTDHYGFNINFFMFGVVGSIYLVVLAFVVPARTVDKRRASPPSLSLRDLRVCLSGTSLLFFIEVALMGAAIASVERLLFVFLQSPQFGINASMTLCGLSVAVSVLFEIPIFYFASDIVSSFGTNAMWTTASVMMSLRCGLLSRMTSTNTAAVLFSAESLHGIIYASFLVSAVDRADVLMPSAWRATAQNLLYAAYSGIGVALGASLGGFFMQSFSPSALYLGVGVVMAVHALARMLSARCRSSQRSELTERLLAESINDQ